MKFYNPFKWHLVKNDNEQYAVRRWELLFFSFQYVDFLHNNFAWGKTSRFYSSCVTPSLEKATTILDEKLRRVPIRNDKWTIC